MARYNFTSYFSKEVVRSKVADLQPQLEFISGDIPSQERVVQIHKGMEERLEQVNLAVPKFDGKMTNPFVNSFLSKMADFHSPTELESVITPSKQISSLETAAGRIVEDVVPQVYGWKTITSETNTPLSEIDCAWCDGDWVHLTALKSGPACINDSMSGRIASAIVNNYDTWSKKWNVKNVHFVVGMNYSTAKNSNKKDWHILRLAQEGFSKMSGAKILKSCFDKTNHARPLLLVKIGDVLVQVETMQGEGLWNFMATKSTKYPTTEICLALSMLASKNPTIPATNAVDSILDSSMKIPPKFKIKGNLPISWEHLPWYFVFYRHFVDQLTA